MNVPNIKCYFDIIWLRTPAHDSSQWDAVYEIK